MAISNGTIAEENGFFRLKVSLEFNSPRGAAAFVLDHNANGWTSRKNKYGKALKNRRIDDR